MNEKTYQHFVFIKKPGYIDKIEDKEQVEKLFKYIELGHISINLHDDQLTIILYELSSKIIGINFMNWLTKHLTHINSKTHNDVISAEGILITLDPSFRKVLNAKLLTKITPLIPDQFLYIPDKNRNVVKIRLQFKTVIEESEDITTEGQKLIDELHKSIKPINEFDFNYSNLDHYHPLIWDN